MTLESLTTIEANASVLTNLTGMPKEICMADYKIQKLLVNYPNKTTAIVMSNALFRIFAKKIDDKHLRLKVNSRITKKGITEQVVNHQLEKKIKEMMEKAASDL